MIGRENVQIHVAPNVPQIYGEIEDQAAPNINSGEGLVVTPVVKKKKGKKKSVDSKVSFEKSARDNFRKTLGFNVVLILSTLLCLADIVCISFGPTSVSMRIQICLLLASTILFFFGLLATAVCSDDDTVGILMTSYRLLDGPAFFELMCLSFGWVFFYLLPGLSALRCLRVFRQFWYLDFYFQGREQKVSSEGTVLTPAVFFRLCCEYMGKVGSELFTTKSRGGTVILLIFFFVTYIQAVVFWYEKPDLETSEGQVCRTVPRCYFTMIRLSLYDQVGLDYLGAVIDSGASGLAVILMLHLLFTSVVLLNGLIGVFGYGLVLDARLDDRIAHLRGDEIAATQSFPLNPTDISLQKEDTHRSDPSPVNPSNRHKELQSELSSASDEILLSLLGKIQDDVSDICESMRTLQEEISQVKASLKA